MILVPDTSVAIKWVIQEEDSERADLLLHGGHELYVPRLLAAESGNALGSKVHSNELLPSEVPTLLGLVLAMPLNWADDETLVADALRLAVDLDHPIYDCVYLALAYRVGGILVTADTRFANKAVGTVYAGHVVLLGDFEPA